MTTAQGPLHDRLIALGVPADMAGATARLAEAGLTDGLPVHPPTPAAVAAYLEAAPAGEPTRPLVAIPLALQPPTRWDLAAVAVMAGCPPEAFGLLRAALAALGDPAFNLLGVQTTTSAVAPLVVVGGDPAAPTLVLGRAVRLALHLLGNVLPGITNLSTQGHPGRVSWCLAEASEIPWPPLHTARGEASPIGVTAVAAVGSVEVVLGRDRVTDDVAVLADAVDAVRRAGLGPGARRHQALVNLPPESARRLADQGLDRAGLAAALAGPPAEAVGPARPGPEVLGVPTDDRPADVLVAVTGGVGIKGTVVQTWGSGMAVSAGVTPKDP